MSDEPKSNDNPNGSWEMPNPVFRTSAGRPPKGVRQTDSPDEVPTEPGFHDAPTVETEGLPPEKDESEIPTVESDAVTSPSPKPKKGGCARSAMTVVSVIALAVIGVAIAVVYFLFYYKSADSTF